MTNQLVIVESPAKARTIGKFLGKGYTVKASMGHVRDLPKSGLGIDVEHDFETSWEEIKDRGKVLEELRSRVAKADRVYLATDPDREGEAIAWHLVQTLLPEGEGGPEVRRVVFHEITEPAIEEAFAHAGELSVPSVDAYRTRRILDRLMGYQLSPLLWKKLSRGLSAGRVQSVAVRLVVEREREIRAFVPEEYWKLTARFGGEEDGFAAEFMRLDGNRQALPDVVTTRDVMRRLDPAHGPDAVEGVSELPALAPAGPFTVTSLESQAKLDRPRPPFITSTLQQAASGRYGFAAKRTMRLAQQLYEGVTLPDEGAVGLITYMRTDSVNISKTAQGAAAELIPRLYGKEYLPEKPNDYRSKKGAQEAHEAIRPTDPARTPESLRDVLQADQLKLYELIWRRFVASQMAPARYSVTTVELSRGGAAFEASGRVTLFDGHQRAYGRDPSSDQQLPEMTEGQELMARTVDPKQHFTAPPRRYSEASLVRALEKHGIGRPSTYASILSTIVDRKYVDHGEEALEDEARGRVASGEPDPEPEQIAESTVESDADDDEAPVDSGQPQKRKSKAFHATHLGEVVTDLLIPFFGNVVDTEFTANMESELDRIAEGEVPWKKVVEDFYARFSKDLGEAEEKMQPYWDRPMLVDDLLCGKVPEGGGPACTAPMAILFNRFGTYLGCSRYPDCRNTLNLTGRAKAEAELTDFTCRARDKNDVLCGRPMEKKVNRWGSPFLACTGFKEGACKGSVSLSKAGEPLWPVETSVPCPECGTDLVIKRSRRGKFLACPQYPKCRGTLSLPNCTHESRTGKACAKPMTEPVAGGKLSCKTHPEVKLAPPPRRKAEGAGDEKAAPKKAAAKKATKKKATAKKASAKKAVKKKATTKKAAAKKASKKST